MNPYTVNIGPCGCCGGGYCNFTWTSTYSCSTLEWSEPTYSVVFSQTKATESTAWNISGTTATWNSEGVSGSSQSDCDTKTPPSPPERPTAYPFDLLGVTTVTGACQQWTRAQFRIGLGAATYEQVWLVPGGLIVTGTQRHAEWNPTAVTGGSPAQTINYPPTSATQSFYITYDPAARTLVFKLQNAALFAVGQTSLESQIQVPDNKLTSLTLNYPIHMFVSAGGRGGTVPTTQAGMRFHDCTLDVTGEPAVALPELNAEWPGAGASSQRNRYLPGGKLGKGFTITGYATMSWTGQRPQQSDIQASFGFVDTTTTPNPVGIP